MVEYERLMLIEGRDSELELDLELSTLGLSCEDREGPLAADEDMIFCSNGVGTGVKELVEGGSAVLQPEGGDRNRDGGQDESCHERPLSTCVQKVRDRDFWGEGRVGRGQQ